MPKPIVPKSVLGYSEGATEEGGLMPRFKDTILDWTAIGAMVGSADSVVQAEFFKGFAEGLKEMDTEYAQQMQMAYIRDQESHKPGVHGKILSEEHKKILANALIMLTGEE